MDHSNMADRPCDMEAMMRELLEQMELLRRENTAQAEKMDRLERIVRDSAQKQFLATVRSMPRTNLRFSYSVAQHCDLNCSGCSRFSPLAEPEYADVQEAERDFARLSELFSGRASLIQLMGGEPLLHPELTKFFELSRRAFPRAKITMITNGLKLLDQPDAFWTACRENSIILTPTKYPIALDYAEMERRAAEHGVKYEYCNEGQPVKTLVKLAKDPESIVSGTNEFLACGEANGCINLSHGRLCTCGVMTHARHFNKYFGETFELDPEDTIDIYQAKSAKEILEFLSKPISFCRYCRISKHVYDIPWHQSKREAGEWLL